MSPPVRLGTRGSPLALWQTEHVRQLLAQQHPDIQFEVVVITTSGDRMLDTPLPVIGGKGVFTAELEQALRERSIDLAVHSLKDLPTRTSLGLVIGATLERADPADVLVSRGGYSIRSLPTRARVGTSSSRRSAQLLSSRSDLEIIDLRGNADTRLRKALDPSWVLRRRGRGSSCFGKTRPDGGRFRGPLRRHDASGSWPGGFGRSVSG